ncbi:Zn-ribbon domain-containing OB-fold protein [Denitratisoma oestradiolicum]|uniref:DNA-binding protein n=1 Tax=Denitratisoma oestradiolicum TaxID=311182 RepID=A0A6S6XXQ1_9PROT|nr:OB-fold domain-containing protein [Denitratisoma oestradiolicum]CAB1370809.1 conserved protein of unknown function [Denitratisoma oestradiolicum]
MKARTRPVVEGLFIETETGLRLSGSRCKTCRTPYFPAAAHCHNPGCAGSEMEPAQFGPRGTLWSHTIQNFPPPTPSKYDAPFNPYAVGVVDLTQDGLRVLAQIVADDPRQVRSGAEVELVLAPLYRDEDGVEVVTWKARQL